ncbi:phosphoadenylyl-sulfate reductase [Shewanella waksmanii]|uniref:phosphoadenylyl-sulfate reductase n=1 Tax=Shewanella waksmanii TaxID=213783 RepID=UPI00146FB477|nr:phosphoadenylyl-sulfate reductase [Shewanella waksmanii]
MNNEEDIFISRYEALKSEVLVMKKEQKKLFITSSFQTQSLPLLHMISRVDASIPVMFMDTGYLFPETYLFVEQLTKELGLNVIRIKPSQTLFEQTNKNGRFLFSEDNELCCRLNKVLPLQQAYQGYDVWISGIRADQSATRAQKQRFEQNKDGLIRYHPMLEWTAKDIFLYRRKYHLPEHPLESKGYLSVGCIPCTERYLDSGGTDLRSGRWQGLKKNECGLHTELK